MQWHSAAVSKHDRQAANRIDIFPAIVMQTHHNIKAPVDNGCEAAGKQGHEIQMLDIELDLQFVLLRGRNG